MVMIAPSYYLNSIGGRSFPDIFQTNSIQAPKCFHLGHTEKEAGANEFRSRLVEVKRFLAKPIREIVITLE